MTLTPLPPCTARSGARLLLHGDCPPGFLRTVHEALARHPYRIAVRPEERDPYLGDRLRSLLRALPPARTLLTSADALAAALAWTAVADPRLAMNLVTHTVLCSGSLVRLAPGTTGTPEVREALDALDRGDARGSYLITETGRANSHLGAMTRAVHDPERGQFVLDTPDPAAAKFAGVPDAPERRLAVVLARVEAGGREGGVFPFLVELADADGPRPGVEWSAPVEVGALPLTLRKVSLHGVRVPVGHWLRDTASLDTDGTPADPLGSPDARLQRSLHVGRDLWGTLPSAAAALARQSTVLALRHSRRRATLARPASGAPLFSHRSQQRALLGALADSYALGCAAARARELLQELLDAPGGPTGRATDAMGFAPWTAVSRDLSAYKAHSVREAERVVAGCQRRCGHHGLVDANRLAGYRGFLHAFDPAGGDSQLILYDLGRTLATEPQEPYEHHGPYVPEPYEHHGPYVPEPYRSYEPGAARRAPAPRPTDPTDPSWWPTVLRAHETALADGLRGALRTRRHLDDFERWNPLLDLAGELGETHAARLAAEDVVRAGNRFLTDVGPPLRDALEDLGTLAALRAARRRAGELLTHGTLAPAALVPVAAETDRLCDRLLPHLPLLEGLFSFPDDIVCSGLGVRPPAAHPTGAFLPEDPS
ncbi:acyl-CoA dehydrogenase [Streptomyces sp. NPDC059247]|uniref:acyl-CoA dehydrogenase family protein n=1 Tax=Streptomyces sp. NPDC059247 TaxID=3346790 RepID=UPI0036AB3865